MNIPDKEKCFAIISRMEMMPHIIDHSIMVCKVAGFMCQHLKGVHSGLNETLITAAALLHDITKTRSFATGEKHAETGGQLLVELGYTAVGDIVRQHVLLDTYAVNGSITETEIVNYSDKRVLHDQIVHLDKRLEYILEKYGTSTEFDTRIKSMWEQAESLEKKLFSDLDITPDHVSEI